MEMRKCKECGKLFQPKGREQYCPDIHYRPCPICGKPVEAKYLSDPARACSDCKGKRRPAVKPSTFKAFNDATNESIKEKLSQLEDGDSMVKFFEDGSDATGHFKCKDLPLRYIGPDLPKSHFIIGHVYEVTINYDSMYTCYSKWDITDGKEVYCTLPCSSKISLARYFSV